MYPKCSLSDSNIYLQIVGLLSLVIIMIIAWFYYMRVCHTTIMEKYEPVIYKEAGQLESGNRSTYPRDKYPGAQMDLIGKNTTPRSTDKYELRDCKVYFTDDTGACDGQGDNGKTCSYNFDGWQEFATYTDKNGNIIEYPKKIYKQDATNTDALINSYFTSKCFKKFDNNGDGGPKPFEYTENNLVKYDSKGSTNNTEIDTNVFAGKKYTSMQFLNNPTNPGDNFNNVLDSICSIRYNPLKELVGKKFYKFVLKADNTIGQILKVELNAEQTAFNTIKNDNGTDKNALLDFSSLGSHGLKFVTNNATQLEVFISSANIRKPVNVYKFNYVSYLCPPTKMAQITNFVKTSTEINLSDFIAFGLQSVNTPATEPNPFTFPYLDKLTANRYYTANTDYKAAMIQELKDKKDERIRSLNGVSNAVKDGLKTDIANKEAAIFASDKQRNEFYITNGRFSQVINLVKTDRNGNSSRIFKYYNGYNNINLSNIPLTIPSGCEFMMIEGTGDVCLIFKNTGDNQTRYDFSVPSRGYMCDILIVGGGGSGSESHGGGGGAGAVIFMTNVSMNGSYTVNVGKGGVCQVTGGVNGLGSKGNNSEIFKTDNNKIVAEGGGGGGQFANANGGSGGSGGGGDAYNIGVGVGGAATAYTPVLDGVTGIKYGNNGGNAYGNPGHGGGGGGAGGAGENALNFGNDENERAHGGVGIKSATINSVNYDFKTLFGTNTGVGVLESDGFLYFGGGGGNGRWKRDLVNTEGGNGGLGGGGKGGWGGSGAMSVPNNGRGYPGINGTGGGGGGGADYYPAGGDGGSGIVIIRIKNIIPNPPNIDLDMDKNYSIDKSIQNKYEVSLAPNTIQTNIITAFVFLQKGYYRFRAELGINTNGAHPKIKNAHLMIYDESNFDRATSTYKCGKVFIYNSQNKPAHLKQFVHIPKSKFFKIAYYYLSHNLNATTDELPFNMYYDYSANPQQQTYPEDILSSPRVSSNTIGNTDKYAIFNYRGDDTGRGQTRYTFTLTEDLICDILVVGGGGSGSETHGGGGGAGAVIFMKNVSMNGTYTINVGKGGVCQDTGGFNGVGRKGNDSELFKTNNNKIVAEGGGGGGQFANANGGSGGSGGGGDAYNIGVGVGGAATYYTPVLDGVTGIKYGNNGGNAFGNPGHGGGGGGAGGVGKNALAGANSGNSELERAHGGVGIKSATINSVNYDFKTLFGTNTGAGILESDGFLYFGGGGGNGRWKGSTINAEGGNGGLGGGGKGGWGGGTTTPNNGRGYPGINGTGGGGGGGGDFVAIGGDGGSGIVIIRYRLPSERTSAIPLNVLNNNNNMYSAENLYVSNNITNVRTPMYDYLYYGSTLYTDYKNTADPTIMNIFSGINDMNYEGNNYKQYENLATYLNNSVDYFNTNRLRDEKKEFERQLQAKDSELDATKTGDPELIKIDQLSNNITSINYNNRLPMTAPVLKNVPITNIFCKSNDNIYITYDTLNNTNGLNLLTHKLTPAIYIEAIT